MLPDLLEIRSPPPTGFARATVRVLAIDGGGIRGIIPARVLAEIERCTGSPISALFDLIAGTSSGGLSALALARPGIGGPRYSAADVVALYEAEGARIFSRSLWHRLTALGNLIEPKYPPGELERVLAEYLDDVPLSAALTTLLIPSYEIERQEPVFFKSHRAVAEAERDFLMRDVARAATAAPTYFAPARVAPVATPGALALIDGGVYANNPMMCAWVEARKVFPEASDVLVVSLGTGELTRAIPYERARGWGVVNWAQPILDVVFDGVSDTVAYQMRQLLPPNDEGRDRYFRFQTELRPGTGRLDDASPANLRALLGLAEGMLAEQRAALDAVCEQLVAR